MWMTDQCIYNAIHSYTCLAVWRERYLTLPLQSHVCLNAKASTSSSYNPHELMAQCVSFLWGSSSTTICNRNNRCALAGGDPLSPSNLLLWDITRLVPLSHRLQPHYFSYPAISAAWHGLVCHALDWLASDLLTTSYKSSCSTPTNKPSIFKLN